MRLAIGILLLAAAVGAVVALVSRDRAPADRPVVRDAPVLTKPAAAERARFWTAMYLSGRQDTVAGRRIPVWKLAAEPALLDLGETAVGELLGEGRAPEYRASPHLLLPVLSLLPRLPGATAHPRFVPFLRECLDSTWVEEPAGALAQMAGDLRQAVFRVLSQLPDEAFRGDCLRAFEAAHRDPDLRELAVHILFEIGADDALRTMLASFPPNDEEPEGRLRYNLLDRLQAMANPAQLDPVRTQVSRWLAELEEYARHEDPHEAIPAAAALRHLGVEEGATVLLGIYRAHGGEDLADVSIAWTAMRALAEGTPHPFVREECLRVARLGRRDLAGVRALEHLGQLYADEPGVRDVLWSSVRSATRAPEEGGAFEPYPVLRLLLRADRAGVVAFLESELDSGDEQRRFEALRFARSYHTPEIGPRLLAEVRRAGDSHDRSLLLANLVLLGTDGVTGILRSEFERAPDPASRKDAASGLLDTGDAASLAVLAGPLAAGDAALVDLLFERALQAGPYGIPAGLLPALSGAVRTGPGETERLRALTALRLAAPDDETLTADLVDAYRREPSLRVADAIRDTLVEWTHR